MSNPLIEMYNIIKQAWGAMRQQPVLSVISVIGTSLAIFLIMVVVMMNQVPVAPFAPESNRDRFLHARYVSAVYNDSLGHQGETNSPYCYKSVRELFKSLESAEAVTAYTGFLQSGNVNVVGGTPVKVDMTATDADFWRVFDFRFIDGQPYDEAAFESGLPVIVINKSVSRRLFGTTEATGREILLNYAPYTVAGVVEDVSTLASKAYGQIWIPFTSAGLDRVEWATGITGPLSCTILAHDRADFDDIRAEYGRRLTEYNKALAPTTHWQIMSRNRPYDQAKDAIGTSANIEPDIEAKRRYDLIVYIILLIVPAVNLSSMTESRLRQRVSEIGVRRAFGSTRGAIIRQIIAENLFVTLIAGVIGLLLSVVFAFLCDSMLFSQPFSPTLNPPKADITMLLRWSTFLWAMLFCFILNLLSTGIPAWRASRTSVVNAISGRQH